MPWLLASPGHQQPWYWLCRIGRSLSYSRRNFNYICLLVWRNDIKCKYMFMFSLKKIACEGLTSMLSVSCCGIHLRVILPKTMLAIWIYMFLWMAEIWVPKPNYLPNQSRALVPLQVLQGYLSAHFICQFLVISGPFNPWLLMLMTEAPNL